MNKAGCARVGRVVLYLCLSILGLAVPAAHGADGPAGRSRTGPAVAGDVRPGMVVVKFRAGHTPGAGKTAFGAAYGVEAVEPALPFLPAAGAGKHGRPASVAALERVFYVRYGAALSPQAVADSLARAPEVEWAEPYFVQRLVGAVEATEGPSSPNDPLVGQMAHLAMLHLPEAWGVVRSEGSPVVVAIVDGGTDWRHPDLTANVWTNPGEVAGNGADDDGNGLVDDLHGWNFGTNAADPTGAAALPENALHGTATAGAAAAVSDNGTGIAGSSWNATFMPIGASCSGEDRVICYGYPGILYAALNGADIISASWGGPDRSQYAAEVIAAAHDLGALVVAAAGNEGTDNDVAPSYPASFEQVLSVGATRKDNDLIASFSNYGRSVDVFAPGVSIDVTAPGSRYQTLSGTSFSAPLVAGIAALVKTRFPELTVDQLREQLRVTSDPVDAGQIDASRHGKMGLGRVNALRAVTERDHPAIRLRDVAVVDADGDGDVEGGETVQLTATFTNYLAAAAGVTFRLVTDDPFVTITGGTRQVGTLAAGATTTATFTLALAADVPRARNLLLFAEVEAGAYRDAGVVRLVANPAAVADHATAPLTVSVTDEGNIGAVGFAGDSPGSGFVYRGRSLLFEGGLLLATDAGHVSDCIRNHLGQAQAPQDEDFAPQEGALLQFFEPGPVTAQQSRVVLTDAGAPAPLGVTVVQESFIETDDAFDDFVIFKYTITNTNATAVTGLHAGLFFDWDLDADDAAAFDAGRRLGYVMDDLLRPTALAGVKLLTADAALSYRAIDNPEEIYEGFTPEKKWAYLSSGVQRTGLTNTDVSQLMAAGPYTLDPGASVEVAFAVLGGESVAEMRQHADSAQVLWEGTINRSRTGVEVPVPGPATAFALAPVYPNPATPRATLTFRVPRPADVRLEVYDVLGRRVATVAEGTYLPGTHTAAWEGRDDAGRPVASGLYLCRLVATAGGEAFTQTQPVTVVR